MQITNVLTFGFHSVDLVDLMSQSKSRKIVTPIYGLQSTSSLSRGMFVIQAQMGMVSIWFSGSVGKGCHRPLMGKGLVTPKSLKIAYERLSLRRKVIAFWFA